MTEERKDEGVVSDNPQHVSVLDCSNDDMQFCFLNLCLRQFLNMCWNVYNIRI